jgi:hypothetical protein
MEEVGKKTQSKPLKDPKTGLFAEGNPGGPGRPAGSRSFTTKVREALEKIAEGKDYTYEEAFIRAILKKSIVDQDVSMMRTVWEQLDGKPLQRVANADGSNLFPNPIYGGKSTIPVSRHDSNKKDISVDAED